MQKVTLIRTDKKNKRHVKTTTLNELLQTIKSEEYRETISDLRSFCYYTDVYGRFSNMHRLPVIAPSAEMKLDKGGNLMMQRFNGLLTLTIGRVRDRDEAAQVKRLAAMLPMTVAAITGSSDHTVKVLVRVSRPDGSMPQSEDDVLRLCRQAYPLVCQLYGVAVSNATTNEALENHGVGSIDHFVNF
jgi:hypothetical protein